MASQAQDPSIPSASGECHFFKLPPELRTVIYDLLLEDVDFDEEYEDEEDEKYEHDEEEEFDLEEYEDNVANEARAAAPVLTTVGIDGIEGIDTNIEIEEGDEEDMEDSASGSSDNPPQLTRPPILNTCQLIRQEAGPIYNYRLTNIAIELLKETTLLLTDEQELKDAYEHSPWLRTVVMKGAYCMSVQTRMCMDVMDDEMWSLGLRLGVGIVLSEETSTKLQEALGKYEAAGSMLFEVLPGVEGQVLVLPRHG